MRQPSGGFHQFFRSGAAGPFQQVEDLGGLAAAAGSFGLANRLGLGGRKVGATWRNAGLFASFRLLTRCRGCGGAVFFWNQRGHFQVLLGGYFRGHDINPSAAPKMQAKSAPKCWWRCVFPLACGAETSVHGPVVDSAPQRRRSLVEGGSTYVVVG